MNQITAIRTRNYNPGTFQSDDEVIAQFVVRNPHLQIVLSILDQNIGAKSCQHTLIVAPRGQGKTMLLARTAAELRSSKQYSDVLLPIQFMDDNHEISSMADFWLETLFHVSRECRRIHPQLARELFDRHSDYVKQWHHISLEERARGAVLNAAERLGRRLVLMIENLQQLHELIEKDTGWELRQILQTEPRIILLGTATRQFKGIYDANLPFFDFFRILNLNPLNTEECHRLWTAVSKNQEHPTEREMRPLEILTEGNPRLLVLMANFAQCKPPDHLMEELVLLMDEHTDYFRAKIESLPQRERRVFLAILDLWQFSMPREISIRARMEIRMVSAMLGRLVKRGFVIVRGSGKKRLYGSADRLFSIFYKVLRNQNEVLSVENLIRFMTVFYTEKERRESIYSLIHEVSQTLIPQRHSNRDHAVNTKMAVALPHIKHDSQQNSTAALIEKKCVWEIEKKFDRKDFDQVIQIVDQAMSSESQESWGLSALYTKGQAQREMGTLKSAVLICDEIIKQLEIAETPDLQLWRTLTLILKAKLQTEDDNIQGALSTYQKFLPYLSYSSLPLKDEFRWETQCLGMQILLGHGDLQAALETFRSLYIDFDSNNQAHIYTILHSAINLAAAGVSPLDLLEIISGVNAHEAVMYPLILALKRESGEFVCAPEEALEIAADICNEIRRIPVTTTRN